MAATFYYSLVKHVNSVCSFELLLVFISECLHLCGQADRAVWEVSLAGQINT